MKTTQKSENHSKKWKPLYEIQTKLGGLHENRNS